jgi:hypothetical protein
VVITRETAKAYDCDILATVAVMKELEPNSVRINPNAEQSPWRLQGNEKKRVIGLKATNRKRHLTGDG